MRPPLFLDTSGWLAAIVVKEPSHTAARALYGDVVGSGGRLVTTNLVVAELHALLIRKQGPRMALAVLDQLARDASHEVVFADPEIQRVAVDRWLRPFRNQPFSLTDAVSFEVMRQRRLHRALSLDRHFEVAGYQIL